MMRAYPFREIVIPSSRVTAGSVSVPYNGETASVSVSAGGPAPRPRHMLQEIVRKSCKGLAGGVSGPLGASFEVGEHRVSRLLPILRWTVRSAALRFYLISIFPIHVHSFPGQFFAQCSNVPLATLW